MRIKTIFFLLAVFIFYSCENEAIITNSEQQIMHTVLKESKLDNGSICVEGEQPGGAFYKICLPDIWNRELVVFAHGYVAENEPLAIPENQLYIEDSIYIPELITDMGYAFATTSYRSNGLVIEDGIDDLIELLDIFRNDFGRAQEIYMIGASEGGLISVLSLEKNFFRYSGALALCGPYGDFQKQINYLGDFRVVFDYYFPDVIPGSAIDIPQEVIDNWETQYAPAVLKAIEADPVSALQVLKITRAAVVGQDLSTIGETFISVLWYNIFATNNAKDVLGGNPYDNSEKIYTGSKDPLFNMNVDRYKADKKALDNISTAYQTSGVLVKPVVMLHSLRDPVVPNEQQKLYEEKVMLNNPDMLISYSPAKYGHCNFTKEQLLKAFYGLVYQVTGRLPLTKEEYLKRYRWMKSARN